jgi:hypothetical protein
MSMKKTYIGILLIATAILLNACSSDDSGAQTTTTGNESVGKVVQLVSYISPLVEKELSHRAAPAGFSAYTPDKTTNMGIYMLLLEKPAEWTSPEEGKLIYTNKWHAYFDVTPDKTYTVYGYMPKTGEMSSALSDVTENAATLTISNMKPVTTDDICIITGVEASDEGLREGQFSWKWPISTGEDNYKIHLLMDHLYAAAQFRLRIDGEYALLRTIKLKTMTLSTIRESVTAAVTLTHNTTGASPISDVTYTASGSNDAVVIYNSDEGTALDKTTPLAINVCLAPTLSADLTLVSTYDVYDSKGNLIRQNCSATNKLPNLGAVRGQRVQVNMLVNPTYLYVLSDPDLDNPTIKIEN